MTSSNVRIVRHFYIMIRVAVLPDVGRSSGAGDMVHLQENWAAMRVPSFNYDREQSLKSMEKVARVTKETGAELWINHDKAQSDRIPKAPAYIE